MSRTPTTRFFQPRIHAEESTFERIAKAMDATGYRIYLVADTQLTNELTSWRPTLDEVCNELFPEVYERQNCQISFAEIEHPEFQFHLSADWNSSISGEKTSTCVDVEVGSHSRALFSRLEFHPQYFTNRFVEIGTLIYDIVSPAFGWIDRCRKRGYTTEADVESLSVPHLYWGNFFGPAYVESLGEEFLMNAPSGTSKKLADGGIIYTLNTLMSKTAPRKRAEAEAMEYFGL